MFAHRKYFSLIKDIDKLKGSPVPEPSTAEAEKVDRPSDKAKRYTNVQNTS